MKKLFAVALSLFLILLIPAASAQGLTYLALGDSITTGYGLNAEAGEAGFADILAKTNGFTLINKAVDGSTTADVIASLTDMTLMPTVMAADLITITCGGNDLLGLMYAQIAATYNAMMPAETMHIQAADVAAIMANPTDTRQMALLAVAQTVMAGDGVNPGFAESAAIQNALGLYTTALNTIVAGLKAVNPDVTIIITTQYNPYKSFTGMYATLAASMDVGVQKLSQAIAANAETAGYLVADVYSAFAASPDNLCNATMTPLNLDFHPNAQGHAVIADCIQQLLNAAQ